MIELSNFKEVLRNMGFSRNAVGNHYKKGFGAFSMTVHIPLRTHCVLN